MAFPRLIGFVLVIATAGCATLGPLAQIGQPPRFRQADNQPAQIRLIGPSLRNPTGGAAVRFWVGGNTPNRFGFTLSTLNATLGLQGTRAANGDFPLGLPLRAGEQSVVPLDLTVN